MKKEDLVRSMNIEANPYFPKIYSTVFNIVIA